MKRNTLMPIWSNNSDGAWAMTPGPTADMWCADDAQLRVDLNGSVHHQNGDPIVETEISGPAIVRNASAELVARWREAVA